MHKLLCLGLPLLLASCGGFSLPIPENPWLAFNQDFKPLSYSTDKLPDQGLFDVDFKESADMDRRIDETTINSNTVVLLDLTTQQKVPLKFSYSESPLPPLGTGQKLLFIESVAPLKYNHHYRLTASKAIGIKDGKTLLKNETIDIHTEKEPLVLKVLAEQHVVKDGILHHQMTIRNSSGFASQGLILTSACWDENTFRKYHTFLNGLPAGAQEVVDLKLLYGDPENLTPPAECHEIKAFDHAAEREVQVVR